MNTKSLNRERKVKKILDRTGAVLTNDHFLYASGKHGDTYINKDAIYPHTKETLVLTAMWADDFRNQNVQVVVGPAMGGVILSHDTAASLSKILRKDIPGVYAEKNPDDSFSFTRGYDEVVRGKRVLVVEDILTTGGSVKKTIKTVRKAGGKVIGVAALVNRGKVKAKDINSPKLISLLSVELKAMDPENCTLCKNGIPINKKVGRGKKLAK